MMAVAQIRTRATVVITLVTLVIASVLLLRGGDYELRARFANASQLVKGGAVTVAGHKVGSITGIALADDGAAVVRLKITDDDVLPLHEGTRATIRAVGQAGLANRFVDLSPGARGAPTLPSGATLGVGQTRSFVDLDAIITSFGPQQREAMGALVANARNVYSGSGARSLHRMLGGLDAGVRQLRGVAEELAYDRASLRRLLSSTSDVAQALDGRRDDLTAAVSGTAAAFGLLARERRALGDAIERAPAVLASAQITLSRTRNVVTELRPALRDVAPVGKPLTALLSQTARTARVVIPPLADLRGQLPDVTRSVAGMDRLRRPAVRALRSAATAFEGARPILRAARLYATDLILGVFNGFIAVGGATHSRWGHYIHLNFVQPIQSALNGTLAPALTQRPLIPGLFDLRTGLKRRCPGGNTPPAPDKSNPLKLEPALCDPTHDTPASVNGAQP